MTKFNGASIVLFAFICFKKTINGIETCPDNVGAEASGPKEVVVPPNFDIYVTYGTTVVLKSPNLDDDTQLDVPRTLDNEITLCINGSKTGNKQRIPITKHCYSERDIKDGETTFKIESPSENFGQSTYSWWLVSHPYKVIAETTVSVINDPYGTNNTENINGTLGRNVSIALPLKKLNSIDIGSTEPEGKHLFNIENVNGNGEHCLLFKRYAHIYPALKENILVLSFSDIGCDDEGPYNITVTTSRHDPVGSVYLHFNVRAQVQISILNETSSHGEEAVIECKLNVTSCQGGELKTINWFRNRREVSKREAGHVVSVDLEKGQSLLTITEFNDGDEYYCTAETIENHTIYSAIVPLYTFGRDTTTFPSTEDTQTATSTISILDTTKEQSLSYYTNVPQGITTTSPIIKEVSTFHMKTSSTALQGKDTLADTTLGNYQTSTESNQLPTEEVKKTKNNIYAILLSLLAGMVTATLFGIILIIVIRRRRMRLYNLSRSDTSSQPSIEIEVTKDVLPDVDNLLDAKIPIIEAVPLIPNDMWEFPRTNLTISQHILGKGAFGEVRKAEAFKIHGNPGWTEVAVKTLKDGYSFEEKENFMREIAMMKSLSCDHPNIITLLGCCTLTEPLYMIVELAKYGSLLDSLRSRRKDCIYVNINGISQTVPQRELLQYISQIAKGMSFLEEEKFVHRDLATRNILLGENRICKISDFGLARDVDGSDIYHRTSQGPLPIRWMAPESLKYSTHTNKSDVWSYGVVLWEIITLGSTPYVKMTGKEVIKEVIRGYKMHKPRHCSQKIYNFMSSCWRTNPTERPSFSDLCVQIEDMTNDRTEAHLQMNDFEHHIYVNLENGECSGELL